MIKTSFINPFSQEAKKIITEKGSIESIDKENNELIDTIIHTPNQLQDDQYIAHTYKDLAIQRFNYHVLKNIKEYKNEQYQYLFNLEINEYDILSFYILMQAIAISYGSNSQVAKNLLDSEKEIIERRLNILESQPNDYYNQYLQNTLNEMIDTKNLYWDDIQNLLNKNIKLNELILDKGKVIIDYEDFIEAIQQIWL